jgi:thiol-disulfide isomerase/thioredoxin
VGVVLALFLIGCSTTAGRTGVESPFVGKPVPNFIVPRLGDGMGSLADYRGKTVLANLWATWCTPCRHEMPALERLSRTYAPRGLVVVGIDQGEGDAVVSSFIHTIGVTYPILMDRDLKYGGALDVLGLPTSVFVRADGTVRSVLVGELSYGAMTKNSEAALARRP